MEYVPLCVYYMLCTVPMREREGNEKEEEEGIESSFSWLPLVNVGSLDCRLQAVDSVLAPALLLRWIFFFVIEVQLVAGCSFVS